MRTVIILHRYLGVAIGLLMTLWCLSGVVMMYVAYPEFGMPERLRGLAPLDLGHCCKATGIEPGGRLSGFHVEMARGEAILRLTPVPEAGADESRRGINLATGQPLAVLGSGDAREIARDHGARTGIGDAPRMAERIVKDQWTVQHFRRHQPLYRISFDDAAESVLYVDGGSGEVIQDTNRAERFWNWLGAIPHWLYLTEIRQNGALWTQLLVWTSLMGCFLTVAGLAIGIVRLKRRKPGRASPYRGLWAWHHLIGLGAGIFTLTWVASGLFSMTPWGFLESDARATYRRSFNGSVAGADIAAFLAAAPAMALPPGTVRIESAPLGGRLFILAVGRNGAAVRFDAEGRPAPLSGQDARAALTASGLAVARFEPLAGEDAYHYRRKNEPDVAVYRAILADRQATRLYIDRVSGAVVEAADRPARAYRWLHRALHSFDFAWLRYSLWRDAVMLPLMAGVTLICATGCWMGLRRVRTDVRRTKRRARRRRTLLTG